MRRDQLLRPLMAAVTGIAVASSSGAALAAKSDTVIPEPQTDAASNGDVGFFEPEIIVDQHGRLILLDPRSGDPIGLMLQIEAPEIEPYKLNVAQLRAATAAKLSVTDVIVSVEQHSIDKVMEASFEPTAFATTYSLKIYREGGHLGGKGRRKFR